MVSFNYNTTWHQTKFTPIPCLGTRGGAIREDKVHMTHSMWYLGKPGPQADVGVSRPVE